MRPHPEDMPATSSKAGAGVSVASLVREDLVSPKLGILLGPCPMLLAAMPEATVHEDSDTSARKRDVSDPAMRGENRQLNSVSKTSGVENTPKYYLNSSAVLPNAVHPSARLRGGGVSPSARSHVVGFSHAPPPCWYAPGSRTPGCSRQ
jgi:hypothetical protein